MNPLDNFTSEDTVCLRIWELQTAIDNLTGLLSDADACHAMWRSRHDLWACDAELQNIIRNVCPVREVAE